MFCFDDDHSVCVDGISEKTEETLSVAENIIQSLSVSDYDVLTYFRKYMKMTAYMTLY